MLRAKPPPSHTGRSRRGGIPGGDAVIVLRLGAIAFLSVILLASTCSGSATASAGRIAFPAPFAVGLDVGAHTHERTTAHPLSKATTSGPGGGEIPPPRRLPPVHLPPAGGAGRALTSGSPRGPAPLGPPRFGNISNPIAPSGSCFGIWPPGGQSYYANGCYGHDEPGIQFYSSQPGSGGNVTWNITLPVSRNSSATQSDLYTAIWFGMTLSDPYAWMDQCFLELQFYPDSDWYTGTLEGSWVGAAVAWQIEAATGYEDACFYAGLAQSDGSEFAMRDGDQVSITMEGWVGSPYGENLTLLDVTSGAESFVNMYNYGQGYPLDPAYGESAFPNSLQWTPGGEFPVVFAFETGHTVPPFPNNNSFGGCSPGLPPATSSDSAVPCPSYDPGSWVNDTVTPWEISTPTFFNATTRETPVQVSFTQDLGGASVIQWMSNNTCNAFEGSQWCSYPWYSYSCARQAFEFGATDYATTTTDFGAYNEYSETFASDAAQLGYYPPTNFSVPACGASSSVVSVGTSLPGAGHAYFLSTPVDGNRSFAGLLPGEYSLSAIPLPGERFSDWSTTGSVSVADANSPSTTLWVRGNGSAAATFTTAAVPLTHVTFHTTPTTGRVVVLPSFFYTNGTPVATLGNLGSVDLAPGTYSVQAYPPPGYNFSDWSVTGAGASVAAPSLPYTWLIVPGGGGSISVSSRSVSSSSQGFVYYGVYYGSGSVTFAGQPSTTGTGSILLDVGTYSIVATAASGWAFDGWFITSSAVMSDFTSSSNVTIENGTTYYLYAAFEASVVLAASPGGGGAISLDGAPPLPNQTINLYPSYYSLLVAPAPGYAFSKWTVSDPADEWVFPTGGGGYYLDVNASGTVTAVFVAASTTTIAFVSTPAVGGSIEFNFATYASGTNDTTVANGTYLVAPVPAPGFNFTGWEVSGSLILVGSFVEVSGSGGTLTAQFERGSYPVTFVTGPPNGPPALVSLLFGSPITLVSGETRWISGEGLGLGAGLGPNGTFKEWTASPGLTVEGGQNGTLTVNGSGTLTLYFATLSLTASLSPSRGIDLGQSARFTSSVASSGTVQYAWAGVPPGCGSPAGSAFTCTPASPGNFTVNVTVTSSDGLVRTASAGTLTVAPALTPATLTATPANITFGATTRITVTEAGGLHPLDYVYGGLPFGCVAIPGPTFTCTPSSPGISDIAVTVTDAAGKSSSAETQLVVNGLPDLQTFSVTRAVIDVGVTVHLGMFGQGGTVPLSYTFGGLPPGCSSQNLSEIACTPTIAGNYSLTGTITDMDGFSSTKTQSLQVNPDPVLTSFGPTGWSGTVGAAFTFHVAVSGGTGPFAFAYTDLPAGCASLNLSYLPCVPSGAGNYTVTVTVTDVFGKSTSGSDLVVVHPASTPPGSGGGSTPTGGNSSAAWPVIYWAVVAVIAAGAAGVVVWARRRRGAADAPASSEAEADESTMPPEDPPPGPS